MTVWTVVLRGIRYRAGRSLVVSCCARWRRRGRAGAGVQPGGPAVGAHRRARGGPADADQPARQRAGHRAEPQARGRATPTTAELAVRQVLDTQPAVGDRLSTGRSPPVDTDDGRHLAGRPAGRRLAYRDGACRHLTIAEGECPAAEGQVGDQRAVGQRARRQGRRPASACGWAARRRPTTHQLRRSSALHARATPPSRTGDAPATSAPASRRATRRSRAARRAVHRRTRRTVLPGRTAAAGRPWTTRSTPPTVGLDDVPGLRDELEARRQPASAARIWS